MKKNYVVLSLLFVAAIAALISAEVLTHKTSGKTEAFHESLKQENAREYRKSIQTLEAIYKDSPDDYLLNLRLGWLHYNAGNTLESQKYYAQAFTLSNNKSVEALLGQTLPLAALGDWDAVAAAYHSILKLDPMNYTANLRLGQILLNKGSYGDAKSYLERVHASYPGSYEPNLSLGWTYYYLGERQKASSLLTNALMLSPGDTLALQGLNLLK